MRNNDAITGIGKPCELPLRRGHLLIIATGAIGVANLPGWCVALRQWYGHTIKVLLTKSAQELVSAKAIAATAATTPVTESNDQGHYFRPVPHKELASWADLVIVAPATVNFISRSALLLPDSTALFTGLLTNAPVVVAPSVPSKIWDSDRMRGYVQELRGRGWEVLNPSYGLAVSDYSVSQSALPSIYEVLIRAARSPLLHTEDAG